MFKAISNISKYGRTVLLDRLLGMFIGGLMGPSIPYVHTEYLDSNILATLTIVGAVVGIAQIVMCSVKMHRAYALAMTLASVLLVLPLVSLFDVKWYIILAECLFPIVGLGTVHFFELVNEKQKNNHNLNELSNIKISVGSIGLIGGSLTNIMVNDILPPLSIMLFCDVMYAGVGLYMVAYMWRRFMK